LATRVKDLRVAVWLTVGLTQVYRFKGLRAGLALLNLLVDRCWDVLLPGDDGKPRARGDAIAKALDVPGVGLAFPDRVRLVPIVEGLKEGYGYLHSRHAPDDGLAMDQEDFDAAVEQASAQACRELDDDLGASLAELVRLKEALAARGSSPAPGFGHLNKALEDCRRWVADLLQKKCPAGDESPDVMREGPAAGGAATGSVAEGARPAAPPTTREQAYRQLREAAQVLQRLEPHSPIPYLVQRAVQLGEMPFPQLIRALVRDGGVLTELSRELGLPEPPKEAAGE
jgi:type VI secretion system protein ImpA